MSLTQFAMVEELAFLVRDNIPSKHLILSMEEMLVNYLQDSESFNGVLELEPMNPYNRLLVHRLAEIFGFSHKSVGEAEDRHLVLECCPETSIPSILVSDLLLEFGEVQYSSSFDLLKQNIIPEDEGYMKLIKPRPRSDPVVARRLITRALGRTSMTTNQQFSSSTKECESVEKEVKIQHVDDRISSGMETMSLSANHPNAQTLSKVGKFIGCELSEPHEDGIAPAKGGCSPLDQQKSDIKENNLRNEHMGAAKRMFANALGIHRRDISTSNSNETKKANQ